MIQPKKWVTLALQLDPRTETCALYADGIGVTIMSYNPPVIGSITQIGFESAYGDKIKPSK